MLPDSSTETEPAVRAWHPRIRRIHDYWLSLHKDGKLPGRDRIDPCAIPEILPGTWMLDVQRVPFRLRYRLVGTKIVQAMGEEMTGKWLDEARPQTLEVPGYFDRYRRVVEEATPSWRKGRPVMEHDRFYVSLENILLPLASDGETPDVILAHTVFYRLDGQEL